MTHETKKKANSPFKAYWAAYGGPNAIIRSRFLALSIAITLVCYSLWLRNDFSDLPISILPDILGFSIGAFAVWLGFGSDDFKEIIAKIDTKHGNGYDVSNASFLHLILVQTTALLYALIFSAVLNNSDFQSISIYIANSSDIAFLAIVFLDAALRFLGFLLFIYSLSLLASVGMNIFRITTWHKKYLIHRANLRERERKKNTPDLPQKSNNDS